MSIRTNNWDVKTYKNTKLEIHVQSFRTKKKYIILFGRKFEIPSKVIREDFANRIKLCESTKQNKMQILNELQNEEVGKRK